MSNARFRMPAPRNEPVKPYAPDSPERRSLLSRLKAMSAETIDIPLVIGGKEIRTGKTGKSVCPHRHNHVLAHFHQGGAEHVEAAAKAAREAAAEWGAMPWEHRASVFLKAAELLAGPWRDTLNAATMLGQSKNVFQAEIDAACELIDFWRFNAQFMQEIYDDQPVSGDGVFNRTEQRPLEGFVFAVTPFNFTSIAGNLPTAPALMGTPSLWKPASSAVYSAWFIMKLLEEAGLPPGVVNFVPGPGGAVGEPAMAHPDLAGIHFTGSTAVFRQMWKTVGGNIDRYRSYPRIVGETGGKDFVFADRSADVEALATALTRGAFEYQGQKCSAASRAYIPKSLWPELKERLLADLSSITLGDPVEFSHFMNAVIDRSAFDSIKGYIDHAKAASEAEILFGGHGDRSEGYFIQPTMIVASNPAYRSMVEEIFGPVLTVFVFEDRDIDAALKSCDEASPYALTGAIFARDRRAIIRMSDALRHAAGNFYINDKPTGAVVGQQPFGGGRASGTNDKAGSRQNLLRWCSARTIKETFAPPKNYRYPFMG